MDSFDEAYRAALVDKDQFIIGKILSYSERSRKKNNYSILIKSKDGDER